MSLFDKISKIYSDIFDIYINNPEGLDEISVRKINRLKKMANKLLEWYILEELSGKSKN